MDTLTKREREVLIEILRDARLRDQDIADRLNTSRPTVTRIRNALERRKIVTGYSAHINLTKIGFEIHAVVLYKWVDFSKKAEWDANNKFLSSLPEVTMFVRGGITGTHTAMFISLHESLKAFSNFLALLRSRWKDNVTNVEVLLFSIDDMSKKYDLTGAAMKKLLSLQE